MPKYLLCCTEKHKFALNTFT